MYTENILRNIFQSEFNLDKWTGLLENLFIANELRKEPELINDSEESNQGYYLGVLDTEDSYRIGLFYFDIQQGDVVHKKVGLRKLVRQYINTRYGEFDAALVVFDSKKHWRLSFICDIKGESTAPRRYTYLFGDKSNFYNTPVSRFMELQHKGVSFQNIKDAFSVEALTKQFYNDLFSWYQWAVDDKTKITFPNNTSLEDDDRENIDIKIIRLITRIMFVWFIKQKDLVPNKLFDVDELSTILKDFDPQSSESGNYYNAILQNLFFATLNRAIVDEQGNRRGFAKVINAKDVKTLYRYSEMFTISEDEIIDLFSEVPFLNGGLFECLDKTKTIDGVPQAYYFDGFSRNDSKFVDGRYKHRAFIPNELFFKEEDGLFSILSRYNFTIEENTPNEQQVALDPELLGKVFENLLGAYNPETRETARNQSGSFYTPREIVEYMVDESLKSYLGQNEIIDSLFTEDFVYDISKKPEYEKIAQKIKAIKIIDPACGSGAFPMGLLNRMVNILQKITPSQSIYDLKLHIIENCVYGSDIQSIAIQITKLRFFISLICDCDKDELKPNFGIPTLPNLETKFVAADSLIAKKQQSLGTLFTDPQIDITRQELQNIRHEHFMAKSASRKRNLRDKDKLLREKLAGMLSGNFDAPEDAKQLAEWNPYDQNAVSPFFDPEWMFGINDGFDIVIGNPPYIQLQKDDGKLAKLYQDCGYKTFARTGDIYCLFYERGSQLLKQGGHLCYITSNKWMRAGYGEKTREFFANNTNPQLLIDFAGVKIFESATVDTNILLFAKEKNQHKTICAVTNKENKDSVKQLSVFVQQSHTESNFNTSDSWVILSPIEQSIKRKIEAIGTPLKDWNIQINYGIKTGCNEAFIISTEKRKEILSNCKTEEERLKTAEIIRPILRGRDIKKYSYEWANLWLVATFPSKHYNIDEYPSLKEYLLSCGKQRLEQTGVEYYENGIKKKSRKKTNNKWFETQDSISYWDDFNKPKIMYSEIVQSPQFYLDNDGCFFPEATTFFITGTQLHYLCLMLNSKPITYIYKTFYAGGGLGENGYRYKKIFLEKLPIPKIIDNYDFNNKQKFKSEADINKWIYQLYGLTDIEIKKIESFLK